ncbi:hypothetical protein LINPERHAP2_LOCUS7166 [Linum perenne]
MQVNFSYSEAGENKQALVKLVACDKQYLLSIIESKEAASADCVQRNFITEIEKRRKKKSKNERGTLPFYIETSVYLSSLSLPKFTRFNIPPILREPSKDDYRSESDGERSKEKRRRKGTKGPASRADHGDDEDDDDDNFDEFLEGLFP